MKMVTNDDDEISRWLSQHNNLNLDRTIDDIKRVGLVRLMWEGNNHGEKFIQVAKYELTRQRGYNHGEILMREVLIKKYNYI